jgi:hypothetical protein
MNYYAAMAAAFTPDNTPLLIVGTITFAIGFLQYIYSVRLLVREKLSPFPVWMHTFYVAHDSTWAFLFYVAATKYHNNPVFMAVSVAHVVWVLLEIFSLVQIVRFDISRREQFGLYFRQNVSRNQAVIVGQLAAFYALMNLGLHFMGAGSYMHTAILTQFIMAIGPGVLWMRRGSRAGGGMGIALCIIASTVVSFQPLSMWVIAMPGVFDTPWFYLMGMACLAITLFYAVIVARFPAKVRSADGKKPIW